MQILEHRLQRGQIEPARTVPGNPEIAAGHLAAEGGALQVQKPRCAFKIGQGVGVGIDQAVELGAGCQLEAKDLEELRIMPLQDPEQVRDVTPLVIDHLGPWPHRPAQENSAHTDKGLGIGLMRRRVDPGGDPFCQVALAAQPWRHRKDRLN